MYKMIRVGKDYCLVIIVTPPDAEADTAGARYYRNANWQIHEQAPADVFNEVTMNMAISYFSGIADGIGYEIPPEQTFTSLLDAQKFVEERREAARNKFLAEHPELAEEEGEIVQFPPDEDSNDEIDIGGSD